MKTLTLLELNKMVRNDLKRSFPDTFWVQAEVSECKEHFSGHCYLELIQKKDNQDTLCAKARATIWATVWQELGPYFAQQTGSRLMPGHQILAEVSVDFHELYGFSLIIKDIDPSYTLGNQAMRRQEIRIKLEKEGVIDQNKELGWPELPQRIAVISSPVAAGYQDFIKQLTENSYGFVFYTALFPATMQGEGAARSIIEALDRINDSNMDVDVVVIIRGGGAVADLSCFDEYDLCYYCTQFPKPILTGLGHDKDYSILDRVAHTSVKTPTAAAEQLISTFSQQAWRLDADAERLLKRVGQVMETSKLALYAMPGRLTTLVQERIRGELLHSERDLSRLKQVSARSLMQSGQHANLLITRLVMQCQTVLAQQKMKGQWLEQSILAFSPEKILKKGFSLTLHNGKIIRSVKDIPIGFSLETILTDGTLTSTINSKHSNDER